MDRSEFPAFFQARAGRPLRTGADLAPLSSFRIGGRADFLFEARTGAELTASVGAAREAGMPFYVVGGGFNVLFDDAGYRGLLVRNAAAGLEEGAAPGEVRASSGTAVGALVSWTLDRGLVGLEFMAGIPGTVGGALYGNAGAFGRAIGDVAREVTVLDRRGAEIRVGGPDLSFGYRRSGFQAEHPLVLGCVLALGPGDTAAARKTVAENLERRRTRHPPWGTPNAGSYFKNPTLPDGTRCAAGLLLEKAGARGMRSGGAAVYEGHCNFLVNAGKATAADVLSLAAELKAKVERSFGVRLEEEVVRVPADASMA